MPDGHSGRAEIAAAAAELAAAAADRSLSYMEVCGTHTMAIARHGLRQLLPPGVRLVSGPGCPVCVTAIGDLDKAVVLARTAGVTLATFGDLMRVPASRTTLAQERAAGADVQVVYSALDAVDLAAALPDRQIVFIGIGFETTAPTIAAALLTARDREVPNFSVLSLHKTMPAPLRALLDAGETPLDGFILPGHVSVITGPGAFSFLPAEYGVGGVIAGFEADDVLRALVALAQMREPAIENGYPRAVRPEGNVTAQRVLAEVFVPCSAEWRGLGTIRDSGLALAPGFAAFDAEQRLAVDPGDPLEPAGCRCGDVLRGLIDPHECGLFGRRCTPETPVGACMVSSEGACAAHFRFRDIS